MRISGTICASCGSPAIKHGISAPVCDPCKLQFNKKGVSNNLSIAFSVIDTEYGVTYSDILEKTNRHKSAMGRSMMYLLAKTCANITSGEVASYLTSFNTVGKSFASSAIRHGAISIRNDYVNDEVEADKFNRCVESYCKIMIDRHFSHHVKSSPEFGEDFVYEEVSSVLHTLFGQVNTPRVAAAIKAIKKIITSNYVYTGGSNVPAARRNLDKPVGNKKSTLRSALGLEVCGPCSSAPESVVVNTAE